MKLLLSILFFFTFAQAAKHDGVEMPDEITLEGKKLVLNGQGTRKARLVIKVYVGGLYLEKKSSDEKEILESDQFKEIRLGFKMTVKKDSLTDAWRKAVSNNTSAEEFGKVKKSLATLNSKMKKMKKGKTMQFQFFNGKTRLLYDDKEEIVIEDALFAKVLPRVFLQNPPNTALKTGMLGQK